MPNNIYQTVYLLVQQYKGEWESSYNERNEMLGRTANALPEEERLELMWTHVANRIKKHPSKQVVAIAREKYPILQQLIQMNESEVRL